MIWLELTWTDAVFSRTTVVLFLCRNRSSRNAMKINGDFFEKYKKYWNEKISEKSPEASVMVEGAPPPRGRPPQSWAARDSSGPTLTLPGLLLVHKNSSKICTSIGLCLVFLFCKTQKQGKTETSTRL